MLLRFAIILLMFLCAQTLNAGQVVGICQRVDILAKKAKEAAKKKKEEKVKKWSAVRDKVREALKKRAAATTAEEKAKISIPDTKRTLLFRIEAAREKVEKSYFAAKRKSKLLRSQLSMTEHHLNEAKLAQSMATYDIEDLGDAFDFTRMTQLGITASSPVFVDPQAISDLIGKKRNEIEVLKKSEESGLAAITTARSKCSPAFSYVRVRAGLYGEPDFAKAKQELETEIQQAKTQYESAMQLGQAAKSECLQSKAAVKAATSPAQSLLSELENKKKALKKAVQVVQEKHFVHALKRTELKELDGHEKLWLLEKEQARRSYDIRRLEGETKELLATKTLASKYQGSRDDLINYKADVRGLEKKVKELTSAVEEAKKVEKSAAEKLKRFVDAELREKEAIERAEAKGDSSFFGLLMSALGKGVKWLWERFKEIPSVVSAMAFMKMATPGYLLELLKQMVMFAVGVVSDIVFAAAPALGMAVGFLINQLDGWISSPKAAQKPVSPAIVLNVSEEASKYYFLSTDGNETASSRVAEMVVQYKKFLRKVRKGYDESMRRERQRAKEFDGLLREYQKLNEALTAQKQEYKSLKDDYREQRKIINKCEKELLPFRQAQKSAQQSRALLYGLKKELAEASTIEQAAIVQERIDAEKSKVEKALAVMKQIALSPSFKAAGKHKQEATEQIVKLRNEGAGLISAMHKKVRSLQNLQQDMEAIRAANKKGEVKLIRPTINNGLTLLIPKQEDIKNKPVAPSPKPGQGKPMGHLIKWAGDWSGWYQGELKKAGITSLLEPFIPEADEAAAQAKSLLSLKAKGRRVVDNLIGSISSEFNDKLLPLASGPLALAQDISLKHDSTFVTVASDLFGSRLKEYSEFREVTWKYVNAAARFEVPAKMQAAEKTMELLEKAVKELDTEMTLFQKLGGLTGPKEEIDEVLTRIRSLVSQVDDGAKQMSDDLGSLFKAFNSSIEDVVQEAAPSARAQTREVMERVLKETFGEAIEESSGSSLFKKMNGSLMSYFKKNAFSGTSKSVGRMAAIIKPIVNGPAVLLRKMAASELSGVAAFAKGAQENITGLYINILYLMKDLYSLIDVEDPCFPDQPLLKHDKETGKPITKAVEIPIPAGDKFKGWIEVHDVTSGVSPKSFVLEVHDVTKGSKGPYAKAVDLFAKGTPGWKSLGENPLDENRRGKGIKVLQEQAYKNHINFKWMVLLGKFVNPLLALAGVGNYEGEVGEPIYLENKIKRVRFNFELDLKDCLGHTFRLSPKVYDRAGRPSNILRRDYFVKFVRDVVHPTVVVKTPEDGAVVENGKAAKIEFSIDDVTAIKGADKADGNVSGVLPGNVTLEILRHGKAIMQETMTGKAPAAGKLVTLSQGYARTKRLIKDPVVYSIKKELPEGEYELRITAQDRAGNVTTNGTAQKGKVKTKVIRFVVGNPKDVLIQATVDPYRPSYGPGAEAEISLRIVNRLPRSAIKELLLRLPKSSWQKHIEITGNSELEKGKTIKFSAAKAGSSINLKETIKFKVPQKDIKQGALIELPFEAQVTMSTGSKPLEANFVVHLELKGRLAASDIFFEGEIRFKDVKGEAHHLPYGTKVGITHIYEMPLAGLGASGLQAGGKKFVEQHVGFGEIDNNAGHLLCRVRPVGGGRKDRFRIVAHSFAVTPKRGGGKKGIASVVGRRRKLPFKIVSQPFHPDVSTLRATKGGVRFLRPKSTIIIPGPKDENHPVELKHEGCLTTGGHINPWGDMGSGGGAAFAMSMTLAGQMANLSTMNKPSVGDTIPGLMWRNHTDAFCALKDLVKAYRFSSNLSRVTVPSELKREFGNDFIPLLAGNTQATVGPYGDDETDDDDTESSGEGEQSRRRKKLELLNSLRRNISDNEEMGKLLDALLVVAQQLEKSSVKVEEAEKDRLVAEGRLLHIKKRINELKEQKEAIQAAIIVLEEEKSITDTPVASAQRAAQQSQLETILSASEIENRWLSSQQSELSKKEKDAIEKENVARNDYSAQRTRYLELKTAIAGISYDHGLDPSILSGLSPVERFEDFANYVPPEEKKDKSRKQMIEVYLAQLGKERLRRQLKKEPLPVKGQTARWWPAGPREDERQVTLYRRDYEGNERIMIPAGSGKDCLNSYRLLRAYGAYVRENFIEKTSHKKKPKSLPRYTLVGPIQMLGTDLSIEQAWDEGFDTFFASAILSSPQFIESFSTKPITYHSHLADMGQWTAKLKNQPKGRGLDNPAAVATLFWLLYERFGDDFLANLLGYGSRLHLPKLASYYPELSEAFRILGLLPVLTFEQGKHGLPIVRWHDNGIVKDCRNLDFIVEYSHEGGFHGDVVVVEGNSRNVIDFGAALKPEGVNDVLGNRLEDGKYYFRAKMIGQWVNKIFGQAYTATSMFVVSRPKKKIGPSGGTVPFKAGTVNGRIEIGADALARDVDISVTPLQLPAEIEGYQVVGETAFELLPEVKYQKAASLVFEYTDDDVAAINEGDLSLHVYDKERKSFVPVPAEHDQQNNRLVAKRNGHSIYALLVDTQPPAVLSVSDGPDPFDPRTGVAKLQLRASEPASFSVSIMQDQKLIKTIKTKPALSGEQTALWDGRDSAGQIVADGKYSYQVTAEDMSGKKSTPVTASVYLLTGEGGALKGRLSIANEMDFSIAKIQVSETTLEQQVSPDGTYELKGVPPGVHEVIAVANEYFPEVWSAVSVKAGETTSLPSRRLTNTALSEGTLLAKYVTPDNDGMDDDFVYTFTLDRDLRLTAEIKERSGKVIARPIVASKMKKGEHTISWDCRTLDGVVETNGEHEFSLVANVGKLNLLQCRETFIVDEGLARDLFVTPRIISPNGDGLDDVTSVVYTVTSTAEVTIEVVDKTGSPLNKLVDKKKLTEGHYSIDWIGDDFLGNTLADGVYRVVLTSKYPDGHISKSFIRELVVDSVIPEIRDVSPMNGVTLTTGLPVIEARLFASPGDVPPGNVKVKIDEHTVEPDEYSPLTGLIRYRPKTSLGEGTHIAIVYARDIAGNEAPPQAVSFKTVFDKKKPDRRAPAVECVEPLLDSTVYRKDPSFELKIFDEQSGIDPNTIELHIDGERVANSVVEYIPGKSGKAWDMWQYEKMKVIYDPLEGRVRYNSLNELKRSDQVEGTHTWRFVLRDKAGNKSTEHHGRFKLHLDTEKPMAIFQKPKSKETNLLPEVVWLADDDGPAGADPFRSILAIDGEVVYGRRVEAHYVVSREKLKDVNELRLGNKTLLIEDKSKELQFKTPINEAVPSISLSTRGDDGLLASTKYKEKLAIKDKELCTLLTVGMVGEKANYQLRRDKNALEIDKLSIEKEKKRCQIYVKAILDNRGEHTIDLFDNEGQLFEKVRPKYVVTHKPQKELTNNREHVAALVIYDRAGNKSDVITKYFNVSKDEVAPTIVSMEPRSGRAFHDVPTFSATFYDLGGAGVDKSGIILSVDGRKLTPVIDLHKGVINRQLSNLSEGQHIASLTIRDKAGNIARRSSKFYVTADREAPKLLSLSPRHGSSIGGSSVRVQAILSDSGSGIDPRTISVSLDGKAAKVDGREFDVNTGELSITLPIEQWSQKKHIIGLDVRDYGGNRLKQPAISVFTATRGGGVK